MSAWCRRTYLLVVIFALTEIAANWLAATYKLSVGPLLIPGGSFLIPISLLVRDGLHLRHPRSALWVALAMGAGVSGVLNSGVARVAFASVVAFVVAFGVDTWVFNLLRRRSVTARMRGSNWASLPVDTLVFVPLAFAGLFPLGALIPGQIVVKLVMTEVAIGVYLLWKGVRA
jgi:hypothetical protein